ncbi:hypothetical protein Asppvi_008046 [Aspergillus pseudoviridinutans]|uniref:Uncharacterized protein n=1 Tax=Aspergillus pseudoviridinutans TaxID=1517512 RepID=A0A9P3BCY9_9EURO|nr:uncharacterized protein Asppvi_008046 [Aspergillus pseudoviridinutans]GIJ89117.1 hypothetical protein Asppvi_008046 [Aspergillus pseudoviridinutans]
MAVEDGMEENKEVKELTITRGEPGVPRPGDNPAISTEAKYECWLAAISFQAQSFQNDGHSSGQQSAAKPASLDFGLHYPGRVWSLESGVSLEENGDSRRAASGMPKRSEARGDGRTHTRPFAFGWGSNPRS